MTVFNKALLQIYKISSNRGMDKKDVVHMYNGILLNHKKERKNAICSNMDGHRDCHTEWNKSEKDKYHMITHVESKKRYKWIYLQNRNRVTDVEKRLIVTGRRKEKDKLGDWDWHIYTTVYKKITSKAILYSTENSTRYCIMTYMGK